MRDDQNQNDHNDDPLEGHVPSNDEFLDDPSVGRTTSDISDFAAEARRMATERQLSEQLDQEEAPRIEMGRAMIQIEIQGGNAPLVLELEDEIVIGRRDPSTKEVPDIDLTPYGAYQMGISRRHAIIRVEPPYIMLTDLGSRNGTFVNGTKLDAHHPTPIGDGDEVSLGKIMVRVSVQSEDET
jgi:pSer/pThr/pTyr-binding forkhead associated (FHA) protein